jgi:hypothetical protein
MRKTISAYLLAAFLLPLSGVAYGASVPSFNYFGDWSLTDGDGDSFYETMTFTNPLGPGAGIVSSFFPSPDGLLGGGEYIQGLGLGGAISLTLDPTNFTSGVSYAFNPVTYVQGFSLYDDNGDHLFSADLTATSLEVVNSTASINSFLDLNLTNIVAGASYVFGTSAIIDALLSAPGGAANFTINMAGSLAAAIEAIGGFGTYSGSASVVPIPAALPLFLSALGALGFVGWRRRRA